MDTTEAVDLARLILDDSEDEHPTAMYVLNVREARTLANAVARVEALADRLDNEAAYEASRGEDWDAASLHVEALNIRLALKGDDA